jgi:excisionase family DNA binding protein
MATVDLVVSSEPFALSPSAAAKRLGIDVSTVYKHYGAALRSGRIRSFKIGKARRIVWASLLAYIDGETQRTRR